MTEFTLPVSPEPILGTASSTQQSGTPTGLDKCLMQMDALRGALMDWKRATQRIHECEDAYFKCRYGVSLKQVGTGTEAKIYNAAISINSGLGMMGVGFERLAIATGIKIE
jgi:hypothetical protein